MHAKRVTAQLHLSNQFSSVQMVVTVNVPCHNERLLAQHQNVALQLANENWASLLSWLLKSYKGCCKAA